jgi:uncharacterized protein
MNASATPPLHEIQMQWRVRIPLRDGACLAATAYLPLHPPQPSPAIFVLTPYTRQVHHDQGIYFAAHGYPFLSVDVRGRGDSDGTFHPIHDAQDGHDIVEWLARQPYCNGKVAMWGGSYMGYCQWATAKEFPPHLSTIVPVAAPFRGIDSPLRNNLFVPYTIRWLTYLSGRAAQDRIFADTAFWNAQFRRWFESGVPFEALDDFLGNPSPIFREWIAHPQQDEYWDRYNPSTQQYSKLDLPILTVTGSYDGNQAGALGHYREHMRNAGPEARARHYLVIGPWDHAGTRIPKSEFGGLKVGSASLMDLPALHLQWYAWTMHGGPKPAFLRKNVAYYVTGADEWRYADSLESVTAEMEPLYLHSAINPTDVFHSGTLRAEPPAETGSGRYVHDPLDVSLAQFECGLSQENWIVEQRMIHAAHGRQLIYHGAPLTDDIEISGFFRLTVWLSIDRPDTDLRAAVYEIASDGSSVLLATNTLRARYRENLREQKLIRTAEPQRYDFERFNFVSRRIARTHRLRLTVGPIHSIHHQKNYQGGGIVSQESSRDARTITVDLIHGPQCPSALYVPLGRGEH